MPYTYHYIYFFTDERIVYIYRNYCLRNCSVNLNLLISCYTG